MNQNNGFSDPITLALLGASAGFLDPRGGMMGGFQGALNGLQAGHDIQSRELMQQKMHQDALQRIEAQEFLKQHKQAGTAPRELAQQASLSGNPVLMTIAGNIAKLQPKVKTTEKVMKDGNAFTRPVFDDGTFGDVSDMPVASQMSFQNLGDKTIGVNPYTGQPLTQFAQGISPGQSASLAQSARHHADSMGMQAANYGLAQQRLGLDARNATQPKLVEGAWVYPPTQDNPQGAIVPTDMFTPPKGSAAEREKGNAKVAEILGNDTADLIKKSTGSLAGTAVDLGARSLGVATPGAKAIATLKMRTAQLAGNVPRFEGPQSNADREYYVSMVGQLDDSTLPVEQRLQSLRELERIHKLVKPNGSVNLRTSGGMTQDDGWGELR